MSKEIKIETRIEENYEKKERKKKVRKKNENKCKWTSKEIRGTENIEEKRDKIRL